MKNLFTLVLLLVAAVAFSQELQPVKAGYITFNSGATLHFTNLTVNGDTVTYLADGAESKSEISIKGIRKVVDNSGTLLYGKESAAVANTAEAAKPVFVPKQEHEKLVYKSYIRISKGDKKLEKDDLKSLLAIDSRTLDLYEEGYNQAMWGDILIGGGIGFAVGSGVANLLLADDGKKGSPAGIIVGAVAAVIGIPVKLGGTKKVKEAVNRYNTLPADKVSFLDKAELKITAGAGTVGFSVRF